MIKTNLANVNTFEKLLKLDIKNITTLLIPNIKLTEDFVDSLNKFDNLRELDISKNTKYYVKLEHDYEKYIDDYKKLNNYQILSETFKHYRDDLISSIKYLGLDLEQDLISQLESCIKYQKIINKFESILPKLNIEIFKTHYISDKCIQKFITLKELEINYNQFIVFTSYNDIFKVILNNKNIRSFVFNNVHTNFTYEDLQLATRNCGEEYYLDSEIQNYFCQNYRGYPNSCANCDLEIKDFPLDDFDIFYLIDDSWRKTESNIEPLLLSKNLKKLMIYIIGYDEPINILSKFSLKKNKLKIFNVDNMRVTYDINNLPHTIKEFHCTDILTPLNNLPTGLKKIRILEFDLNNKKFLTKIPFGCKIIDKNNVDIQI